MSNLDNLVSKILKDGEEKSKQITESANVKASATISEYVMSAEKEKERILAEAEAEAAKAGELIMLGKKLEIRDKNLNAKQEVMDRVFDQALIKLKNMGKDEFWKFLCSKLLAADIDGDEIILPEGYGAADVAKLNDFLTQNNKNGNLIYNGERTVSGGFILVKAGIENNNTFESLMEYYRYELESIIIAELF